MQGLYLVALALQEEHENDYQEIVLVITTIVFVYIVTQTAPVNYTKERLEVLGSLSCH